MNNNLVIDLDGTLIKTDILIETLLVFIKKNPFNIIYAFLWLVKGKAFLKNELAKRVDIDVSLLPYNQDVIDLILERKSEGFSIILATASNIKYAVAISQYLNCFDTVLASDASTNLSAKVKADKLIELYGARQFDYAGNSKDDIIVWSVSKQSIIINPDVGVVDKAKKLNNVNYILDNRPSFLKTLLKALRVHQYAKNTLIFIPLAASHELFDISSFTLAITAFFMFSLCASTVYLLNDLLDLEDDRHHRNKCRRPFASGTLDIRLGIVLCPLMLIFVVLFSIYLLPVKFILVLSAYYVLTILYSFKLKRMVMVDVIALATLYTTRIIAGSVALNIDLSFWLLAFSMFIFLSLALVKRYAELKALNQLNAGKVRGRGYHHSDLDILSSLGAASGYISVLVLALYINDATVTVLYKEPIYIWLACPLLLYWISRTWMITHRGNMHDDPIVFALKDRVSQVIGLLFVLVFWMAI
ncbi:UbiA family prenyltransferase [Aeromonas veronii]